jgi:phosphatidylserine/phosphatidylglycerophosphate/cardiolipin synthase-like enzyme
MSTQTTGRLLDAGANPLAGLHVEVVDVSALFDSTLGSADTAADGTFTTGSYDADALAGVYGTRRLAIRVWSHAHRLVHEIRQDDGAAAVLALGDIAVPAASAPGFAVTLGQSGPPQRLSHENAVQFLVDDLDAWRAVADTLTNATSSIDVMQLEFDIPRFDPTPANERPEIVLEFGAGLGPGPGDVRKVDNTDVRLERLLLQRARDGLQVRVLISDARFWQLSTGYLLLVGLILLALPITTFKILSVIGQGIVTGIRSLFDGKQGGGFGRVRDYFQAAGSANVRVQAFPTSEVNRVHAKLVLVDSLTTSSRAVVVSSPFIQGYYDSPNHVIDDPRRGSGVEIPIHDVSLAVRGPAVADIHAAYRLHWERASGDPAEVMPAQPAIPDPQAPELPATLQLVRTLNGGDFPSLPDGEKGILEAYVRAIEQARTFIYLENQYFTHFGIGDALVDALKATPQLRIIVLVNVTPDIPFYPNFQQELIGRIRDHAGADATRIGFFTAWSHESAAPPAHLEPRIMANYVHTKVAIVDDVWATIGSANLDGASLDAVQVVFPVLKFGSWRNSELNYTIFDDSGGNNAPAVGQLRRALWSEHLGMPESSLASPPAGDWLQLWKDLADQKLTALKNDAANPKAQRILAYPTPPVTSGAGDYLKALGALSSNLELVDGVRFFSFKDGKFK